MSSRLAVLAFLCLEAASFIGCASSHDPSRSTLESSALQLRSAERSGYPTEIVIVEQAIDAREAVARRKPFDRSKTHLVLTVTDAEILWAEALEEAPPVPATGIVDRWVLPYLRKDDVDGAVKAFVFGYLASLHDSGLIDWDESIVPFLPPSSRPRRSQVGGLLLALLVALIVARSTRYLR